MRCSGVSKTDYIALSIFLLVVMSESFHEDEFDRDLELDIFGWKSCDDYCKMDPKGTKLEKLTNTDPCPPDGIEKQKVMLFSDWDDTMICSGTSNKQESWNFIKNWYKKKKEKLKGFFGGVDRTLTHGTFYPGVLRLYKFIAPYMILLSANPTGEEDQRCKKFKHVRKFGKDRKIPYPIVVRVLRGTKASFASNDKYGREKVSKLKEFQEHNINDLDVTKVFVGDNGQGDIITAKDAIFPPNKKSPQLLNYALIHLVSDNAESDSEIKVDDKDYKSKNKDAKYLKDGLKFYPSTDEGVYVFRTYIEAAVIAQNLKLTPEDFDLCEFIKDVNAELKDYNINEGKENQAWWHPNYKKHFNILKFSAAKGKEIKNHFQMIQKKIDQCGDEEYAEMLF